MTSNKAYAACLLRGAMSKVYVHLDEQDRNNKESSLNTYYEDNFGIFRSEVGDGGMILPWKLSHVARLFMLLFVLLFKPLGKEGDIVV